MNNSVLNALRSAVTRAGLACGVVLTAGLLLAGCSGETDTPNQQSSTSQQGGTEQMPPSGGPSLSAADVSEEQVQTAARIAASVQMGLREDRMALRKDIREKYGDPAEMDSAQKVQARQEIRRRQGEMRKKQMKIIQQEAQNEGMDPNTFQQIMRSARQDSTLQRRLQTAMKEQMKQRMQEQMQNRMQQDGSGQQ